MKHSGDFQNDKYAQVAPQTQIIKFFENKFDVNVFIKVIFKLKYAWFNTIMMQ